MSTIELVRNSLMRSKWFIIVAVIVGAVAVNVSRQMDGPVYQSSSTIVTSREDLGAALTGANPGYVDPTRAQQSELQLARSEEVYDRAAEATNGRFGPGGAVRGSVSVSGSPDNDILRFTATRDNPQDAIDLVNAVVASYQEWRAEVSDRPILRAINQIQQRIRETGSTEDLQQKLSTLQLLQTLNSGNVLSVDKATGAAKTSPNPTRDTLLGIAMGLVVGLISMGTREAFDLAIRSGAEAENALELPILASIRSIPRGRRLVTYGAQRTTYEDAYSLLAASLEQRRKTSGHSIIAVTSAAAGEGKSTTASNLAVVLARRGWRCVLVDIDLRRQRLSEVFDLPPVHAGLREALREGQHADPVMMTLDGPRPTPMREARFDVAAAGDVVVAEMGQGSLSVLPVGNAGPEVASTRSKRMRALLNEMREENDWVILDAPPALHSADVSDLSRVSDGMIVVVRQNRTRRRDLRNLRNQMRTWEAEPLGIVLTDTREDSSYGYGV